MNASVQTFHQQNSSAAYASKYLIFSLATEEYGINILKVKEIVGMMPINAVPQSLEYVKGVINLRDKVIPVMDLRCKFAMQSAEYTDRTCIIIVEAESGDMIKCWDIKQCGKEECPAYESSVRQCWMISRTHCRNEIQGTYHDKIEACRKCEVYAEAHDSRRIIQTGVIVDSVAEVVNIREEDVDTGVSDAMEIEDNYIVGMAKKDKQVRILLDIDKVVRGAEAEKLTAAE